MHWHHYLAFVIFSGSTIATFIVLDQNVKTALSIFWLIAIDLFFLPDIFLSLKNSNYVGSMRLAKLLMVHGSYTQNGSVDETHLDRYPRMYLWLICLSVLIGVIAINGLILTVLRDTGII